MRKDIIKINNKSFKVLIELKNIKRTALPDPEGRYHYVFDVYIEGKLEHERAGTYRKNIDWIIHELKTEGLKTKLFL